MRPKNNRKHKTLAFKSLETIKSNNKLTRITMNNWFEGKVKYVKVDDKGKGKAITETYLVDALTFAEAEERIGKEVAPFMMGDFSIMGLKKAGVNEIFPSETGDRWYKCKVYFISIDEVKATEKKVASTILVLATNIKEAYENLEKALSDTMSDYEVSAISETPILDIFPYSVDEDEPTETAKEDIDTTEEEEEQSDELPYNPEEE